MTGQSGEVEKVGVSGEKKAHIVGGFAGILLIAIAIMLLIVIGYLLVGRGKNMPGPDTHEKQSLRDSRPPSMTRG